jgi:hypothetical protein
MGMGNAGFLSLSWDFRGMRMKMPKIIGMEWKWEWSGVNGKL